MKVRRQREMSRKEFAAWTEALPMIKMRVALGETDVSAFATEMTARGCKKIADEVRRGAW